MNSFYLILLFELFFVFFGVNCQDAKKSSVNEKFVKYKKILTILKSKINPDNEFNHPIQNIIDYFFKDFFQYTYDLETKLPSVLDELKGLAQSQNYNDKYETTVYGIAKQGTMSKVLVSGARGTKGDDNGYISSISLIEANEGTSSGIAMAYVILYPNGNKRTEAKVTNYPISSIREDNLYVITLAKGNKQQFDSGDKIIAKTNIYRFVVGENFIQLIEYNLIASAAHTSDGIKSTSIGMVKNTLIDVGLSTKTAMSGFVSANTVNQLNSNSTHYSYFAVDSADLSALKSVKTLSFADGDVGYTKTSLRSKVFKKI